MNKQSNENSLTLKERMERFCSEAVEKGILFSEAMDQFERCYFAEALRRNNGSIIRTAAALGIHRNTLSKKIREWRNSFPGV